MDSGQIILEYRRRSLAHRRAFRVKIFIFFLFLAFVGGILALAWNVESIGRELVLLTFLAPMVLICLIIYDLRKSQDYSCPQCSVNLTHKNPFVASKTLKSCPECKVQFQ